MVNKLWTHEEVEILIAEARKRTPLLTIAKMLGRSRSSVENKEVRLSATVELPCRVTGRPRKEVRGREMSHEEKAARGSAKMAMAMIRHYRNRAIEQGITTHHAMIRCNFSPLVVAAVERSMAA